MSEREQFEAWWVKEYPKSLRNLLRSADGEYHYYEVDIEWNAWQARATIAQPVPESPFKCPVCRGNDGDMPCAYPGEGISGCMRGKRLAAQAALAINNFCPRCGKRNAADLLHTCTPPDAVPAVHAQEPAAYQCREHGDDEWNPCSTEGFGINPRRYVYRALYTAPPDAQAIRDQAMRDCVEGIFAARCPAHDTYNEGFDDGMEEVIDLIRAMIGKPTGGGE